MKTVRRKRGGKVIETFRSEEGPKLYPAPPQNMCKKHPKYRAIRHPRVACYDCWYKWFVDHGFIE